MSWYKLSISKSFEPIVSAIFVIAAAPASIIVFITIVVIIVAMVSLLETRCLQ